MFLVLAALLAPSIHTDFEGGALGKVDQVSPRHYRLAVKGQVDQDGQNRQANWYYFRVDDAPGAPLTLDIVDLPGAYNYRPNRGVITKDTPPVISFDGMHWRHVTTFQYDPTEPKLVLHIQPQGRHLWIAHCPPYTNENLARLRDDIRGHQDFQEEIVGHTVQGRDMPLWTITHGSPDKAKPTIWLMFRQHSWESGSSWVGEGAVRTLLANTPEGRSLRAGFIWKIFPLCDPDGVANGEVRFNVNGYDLNRNWDAVDPLKMPEIASQRDAMQRWLQSGHRVDLLLSLHNTETGEYLEGPPEGSRGPYAPLAARLSKALSDDTSFAPSRPLSFAAATTTAGKPGRMTVTEGLWKDFKIPGFLMEQRISFNPKIGHLPEVPDRLKFGGELVKAMAKSLK